MWIDTREREPEKNGDYIVQLVTGKEDILSFTTEAGWNTFFSIDGLLRGSALSKGYVARWFEASEPAPVPEEWYNEWLSN